MRDDFAKSAGLAEVYLEDRMQALVHHYGGAEAGSTGSGSTGSGSTGSGGSGHGSAGEAAGAEGRLAELGLTVADFEFVLSGADAEARLWTEVAPPVMAGMARWGKTNELLRVRLLPRGWAHDDPRNMPRTISPRRDFAIVAATGDGATGRPDVSARNLYARGYETVRQVGHGSQLAFDYPGFASRASYGDLDIWLLLYHPAGDEVRAELSRPESISPSGYVDGWAERIMLPAVRLGSPLADVATPAPEVTVSVARRAP